MEARSFINNSGVSSSGNRNSSTFYTSQFFNADQTDIFSEICQSIFDDYHSACFTGASFEEIVNGLKDIASNGVQIFERTFETRRKHDDRIDAIVASLKVERNLFDLIFKLFHAELIAQQNDECSSVLKKLFNEKAEFRRLVTLLHWSEESAFQDPLGFSQLIKEVEHISNIDHAFSQTTLQKKFAHLDSCYLDQFSEDDAKNLERIKGIFFCLLRCGRSTGLNELVEQTGLPSLKAFIQIRQAITDPDSTPCNPMANNYNYPVARIHFKNTAAKIINLPDSGISDVDRCIWATLSGNLAALLSYAESPDDILWSYINCAVEGILDEEIIQSRNLDDGELLKNFKESEEMSKSIKSVFSAFSAHCDSIFFKIIGNLAANNFEEVVNLAHADISSDSPDPNKLRLYAHLVLLIKYGEYNCDKSKANEIMLHYSKMLIALDMFTIVPFYLSKLDDDQAQKEMVDFLYDINGESMRIDVLKAAAEVKYDVGKLCTEVYAKAKRENPLDDTQKISDSIAQLLNIWKFLLISPEETGFEALMECNNLLRELFERDRYAEAMELLAIAPQNLTVETTEIINNLPSTEENKALIRRIQDQQREYNSYLLYLEIMEKFSLWQQRVNEEIPERPKKLSDAEYAKLDIVQKAEYERQINQALSKISTHIKDCEQYQNVVVQQILKLLQQASTWFTCCLDLNDVEDIDEHNIRVTKLKQIHERYLYYSITMLITLYRDSHKDQEVIKVANLLMDNRYDLYVHLSKDSLRKLIAEISKSAYVLAVNSEE